MDIVENGIRYTVDVENGQKTGFFWTRSLTVSLLLRLQRAGMYWIVSPIPGPLP